MPFFSSNRFYQRWLAGRDSAAAKAPFARAASVRVCFCGLNRGGSWQIRGVQVASARTNWKAIAEPSPRVWDDFDVFCYIKHPDRERMNALKAGGKTVVLDIVDGWRQPEDGLLHGDLPSARRLFEEKWRGLPVSAWIYPDRTMWEDFRDVAPGEVLYHHFRPDLLSRPARSKALTLAYEGDERFLGPWRGAIETLAKRFGLTFVINPPDLAEMDLGIAARGGEHDSFLARRYKSNVKLANFIGAGVPCLVPSEADAYRETAPEGVRFFSTEAELEQGLGELMNAAERARIKAVFAKTRGAFALETLATEFERFFERVTRRDNSLFRAPARFGSAYIPEKIG